MPWGILRPRVPSIPEVQLIDNPHTLGRGQACNTVLPSDLCISNRHCILHLDETSGIVTLEDTSTNGTFVNKHKVGKGNHNPLRSGDVITFILSEPCITDEYELLELLGKGTFAEVRKGMDRITGLLYAIKVIGKKRVEFFKEGNRDKLLREVEILKRVTHRSIVRIHRVFDTPDHLYLVLDLAKGGDLLDYLHKKGHLNEVGARTIFYQLCDAVKHLHDVGIAHRDLKPENILLAEADDIRHILLTDFGLAQIFEGSLLMNTLCGTPLYVAPEVLDRTKRQDSDGYTKKVDAWSLGVILYILLCGCPPFPRKRDSKGHPTKRLDYSAPLVETRTWLALSNFARDLVIRLLQLSPAHRINVADALDHQWLQDTTADDVLVGGVVEDMKLKKRKLDDSELWYLPPK